MFTLFFKGEAQFNLTNAQAVAACGETFAVGTPQTITGAQIAVPITTPLGQFDLVTTSAVDCADLLATLVNGEGS